ncbi:MAG: hypothetical protein PUH54_02620 [Oscillospiraceae bacterium]|nr:hypothetical protein [Oscillospiraceae bacterium]
MAKEGVIKRTFIQSNIIEELNAKYPPQCESNGVVYKTDLKYITFEPNSDIDAAIVDFDIQIGFGVFNVIFYFAEEMMKGGYKVRVDGYNLKRHCSTCCGKYGVPAEKVQQIVDYLISCNYFFQISDGTYQYLTTCQAVYDYERCMNTRMENRKRKQKSREKYKQHEQTQNAIPPAPPQPPAQICCNQGCDYGDCDEPDKIDIMMQEEKAFRQQNITNPNYNSYCNNMNSFDDCPF